METLKLLLQALNSQVGYLVFALVVMVGTYYVHVGELVNLKQEINRLSVSVDKLAESIRTQAQLCSNKKNEYI